MSSNLANTGKPLEDLLDRTHERYKAAGHYTARQGPPMTAVRRGRETLFRPVGEGPPDFQVSAAGWDFLFEAKSEKKKRWQFDCLEEHQAVSLDRWQAQGGTHVSGVVLSLNGRVDPCYWLPWLAVGPRWWRWRNKQAAHGEAGVDETDCRLIGAEVHGGDWLPVAGRLAMRGTA